MSHIITMNHIIKLIYTIMNHITTMNHSTTRNNSYTIKGNIIITMNFITTTITGITKSLHPSINTRMNITVMNRIHNTKINHIIKKHMRDIIYLPQCGKIRTNNRDWGNTETRDHIQIHPLLLPLVAVLLITASMLK
jgi:hypothetical protein